MKQAKYQEMIETYYNGNISIFKAWLKRCSKLDMLNAIEYYTGQYGRRDIIINTMRSLLE